MAADRPRRADPGRQGRPASTSTPCSPRSRPTRPATRRRILLDQRGYVCEGTGENLFVVKDGEIATPGFATDDPRRHQPRCRRSRSPRDLGYEVVERDIARGELYLADEIFMTGTAAELTPIREVDDQPVGTRRARPDHARGPGRLRGRAARALGALRRLAGRGARAARPRREPRSSSTTRTLRDGMQGEGMSLSVEEKVRVAHLLDDLGVPMIEAGFPASNPKEAELFERLERGGPARRRVRVRDDAPARRRAPRTTRRCACWPSPSRRSARSSARPGALHLEKVVQRRPRREPAR